MLAKCLKCDSLFAKSWCWLLALFIWHTAFAESSQTPIPSILDPVSTPAHEIYNLSLFVLTITGAIFVTVGGLLAFVIFRFRQHGEDDITEPAQIYGSN